MLPVTIIIVTYDAPDSLCACLESVLRHTSPAPFRVVVMDNGPKNRLRRIRKTFASDRRIVFRSMPRNIGKAAAINQAAAWFKSDWYVVLDDDAVVRGAWLSRLLAAAKGRPKIGIVGCRILSPDGRIYSAEMVSWMYGAGGYWERDSGQRDYERLCDAVCGVCMLIRGEVLASIGFDARLRQELEDGDFCMRARKGGWNIFYHGPTAVIHQNLFRRSARRLAQARRKMEERWGIPVFCDSHPIDRFRAAILRAQSSRDWAAVVSACRRLNRIDPAPADSLGQMGTALLNLRRPRLAVQALREALSYPYVSDELRASIELFLELALYQVNLLRA